MTTTPGTGPRLEVQLADCLVELACDPGLADVHARLAELFEASVTTTAAARRVRVEVGLEDSGTVAVSAPGWFSGGLPRHRVVDQVLASVNAGVLLDSTLLTLHAGVVRSVGGALVWPAASGAGKSTLVAACLRRGYPLVSDEALCLDPGTHRAVPYPKPVSLHPRALALLGLDGDTSDTTDLGPAPVADEDVDVTLSATELGSSGCVEDLPVRAVLLISRAATASLAPVSTDQAVAALLRHSFNHWRMPAEAVASVHAVVSAAATYRLSYDDPRRAAQLLVDALPPPAADSTRLR